VALREDESPREILFLWIHQLTLRKKIVERLPTAAESRLQEAVGLYTIPSKQFTDHVVDTMTKCRNKQWRLKCEDKEAMRKLTQM